MYADSLRAAGQMDAHMTWDNTKAIRGRIGQAYSGLEDEPRAVFKVLPHVALTPRFTTRAKTDKPKFYGVFEVEERSLPLQLGKDIIEIDQRENASLN